MKEPYTEAEIKAKIASNDYSAELLLQHAMLHLDRLAASAGEPRDLNPRHIRKFLQALQAGEMSVSRAVEILDAWVDGYYKDEMVPPPPPDSCLIADDEFPMEIVRKLRSELAALAASPTPPAEQQATKETSGGFHVWRDISTAPKDGSRFVATGHNYGLYSEGRHTCLAQWFRGCWVEVSDWNETSELIYLTHWMPLPPPPDDVAAPAEQQAAPKMCPLPTTP